MLIWAVFTLGYIAGVFLTLAVFMKKEEGEEYNSLVDGNSGLEKLPQGNSWELFAELTKPNYQKETSSMDVT
jgi:hypothetical protein